MRPSHLGALLGDRPSSGRLPTVTRKKIRRVLKTSGVASNLPEELFYLIKKAVNVRKHLENSQHEPEGKPWLICIGPQFV
jgi:small subunit ribosomal protein S13e